MISLTRPEGPSHEQSRLSRRAVSGLFFAGYAAAAFSATAEPINTDAIGLTLETVTVPTHDVALPAYLARPAAPGRFPALIVASEIFGVHDYIKDVCRRLARLGYVAIAPAFFVRVADPAPLTDMRAIMKIVAQASDQQVMSDVGAAIAFLEHQTYVARGSLGMTGFCWGGGTTWLACEEFSQIKAGVARYGRMVPPAEGGGDHLWPVTGVDKLHAPVLGLYGAKDKLADTVPTMRAALAAAHKNDSEIIVYPDAGHGFHADYRASYNAADARDGWSRMLAFFATHGVPPRAPAAPA